MKLWKLIAVLVVAAAALWLQLGHSLRLGPLVFGRLRLIVPLWCTLALIVAVVGHNLFAYLVAGVCLVLTFVVRFIWFGFHRVKLHHRLQGSRPWALRSRAACTSSASAAPASDTMP